MWKIQYEWHRISLVSSEFLLDILAIIQFLFTQCDPSIKRAMIFIYIISIFWFWKVQFDSDRCEISQTQCVYTFTLSKKFQVNRLSSFLNHMHSKYQFCIASSSRNLHWITPINYPNMPRCPLYLWSIYRKKWFSSFSVIEFLVN